MKENVTEYSLNNSGIIVHTENHICKIVMLAENIVRVKFCFQKQLTPDHSFAVLLVPEQSEQAGYMSDEQIVVVAPEFKVQENDEHIEIKAGKVKVYINKSPFGVLIKDGNGCIVHRDILERAYCRDKNDRRKHYFAIDGFTAFYGLGEKTGKLNKYKRHLRIYSCDTIGYDSEKTDPLYKHIPFFIKKDFENQLTCGMFYDCTEEGVIDFGCERSGYWDEYAFFSCDGGDIDYYIILGDSIKDVVRRYTDLTGKTIMPTYQSLGYMASTMYYTEVDKDADKAIVKFIDELKDQDLPCDGFHLSSGYTSIGKKRYVFNWNKDRFPDPKAFAKWMKDRKVLVSANVKPALLTDHPLYEEFASNGAFITDERTGSPYLERYWGGMASFVDFSSPKGREMWKKYLKQQLLEAGITEIWNDNNEFEISEDTAICHGDGRTCTARSIKPVFANLMAKTAIDAISEFDGTKRPYILSRSGYAGIQRYAQTWTGDNYTSWKNLKYGIPIILGMGLSGVANCGADIGGFQGPAPDPELFVRWVQNGIFQPRFCIHSCNTDNTVTQPYSYPGYTQYVRDAMKLRYSLGYYLYSLFHIAATKGDPIMRPMVYEFETDSSMADNSFDFMFGPYMLIANVLEKGATTREVTFPKGTDWFNWHTHETYKGGMTYVIDAPLNVIPIFYRAGSIIPLIEPADRMDIYNLKKVKLFIEASEACEFTMYQDDGTTNNYKNGEYLKTKVSVFPEEKHVNIEFSYCGNFTDLTSEFEIELAGRNQAPLYVKAGDKELPVCINRTDYESMDECCYFEMSVRHAFVKFKNPSKDFTLHISYEIKDLIGM